METAGPILAAALDDEALDVKEEILVCAVVGGGAYLVKRHRIERRPDGVRVVGGNDALVREHDQVRVVNRHERRQKQRLGVLEVFVEHVRHVLGSEAHPRSIALAVRLHSCSDGMFAQKPRASWRPLGGRAGPGW